MLVTLLRPTGGSARSPGFDVATEPAQVRRRIGVALQEAALDLLMTGRELIELQATLHGIAPRSVAARGDELIGRVGSAAPQDRRVGTYSGGMRRRLDLAMALIHAPEVLFLDEPTTGLDPTSRLTLWEEVRRLRDEGTTVFLTTQYLEEADQLADRVGIISRRQARGRRHAGGAEGRGRPPHLDLALADGGRPERRRATSWRPSATSRPASEGCHLSIGLEHGASEIAPVRARARRSRLRRRRARARSSPRSTTSSWTRPAEHLEGADEPEPEPAVEPRMTAAALALARRALRNSARARSSSRRWSSSPPCSWP